VVTSNSTAASSRTGTATLGRWLGLWTTEPRRRAGTSVTRAVPAGGFPRARPARAVSDNAHVPRSRRPRDGAGGGRAERAARADGPRETHGLGDAHGRGGRRRARARRRVHRGGRVRRRAGRAHHRAPVPGAEPVPA